MKKKNMSIKNIPAIVWGEKSEKVYICIHGQGGCKEEAELFAQIAQQHGWQALSIDLPSHGERKELNEPFDPWHAVPELLEVLEYAKANWSQISLFANSIGAWFSMLAFKDAPFGQCLFLSPVADMEKLISNMMGWAGVTEEQLEKQKVIPTAFGQTLYWEYWCYVREHRITDWNHATKILYGENDNLVERPVIESFAKKFGCELTVMENGEHWFHTPEQLGVLRHWADQRI